MQIWRCVCSWIHVETLNYLLNQNYQSKSKTRKHFKSIHWRSKSKFCFFHQLAEDHDHGCNSPQTTGYVLMSGRSEYLIPANDPVASDTTLIRRDTDWLQRKVRSRPRRTSSGDSADHSSEQDSSDCKQNLSKNFFVLNAKMVLNLGQGFHGSIVSRNNVWMNHLVGFD